MKDKKIPQNGKCSLCDVVLGKAEMLKHLESCAQSKASGKEKVFWLLVEGQYSPEYWLILSVSANASLEDIDRFLRDIWLNESCGHMSAFNIGEKTYISGEPEEYDEEDIQIRIDKILKKGLRFEYEYDFGSSTELAIKVVAEHSGPGPTDKKQVNLLARNEPPDLKCFCGNKAEHVCAQCLETGKKTNAFLCSDCLSDHDCGDSAIFRHVSGYADTRTKSKI